MKVNYSEFVRSRFKSGEKIAEEMTPHKAAFLFSSCNAVTFEGMSLDWHKKYAFYNKPVQDVHTGSDCIPPWKVEKFSEFKPSPEQCELLHAAIGVAGEAAELLKTVCQHVFHDKPLDRDNVIEELGDLEFYMMAAMMNVGVLRPHLQELNMAKLSKRYEGGYTDQQAITRADKAGEE